MNMRVTVDVPKVSTKSRRSSSKSKDDDKKDEKESTTDDSDLPPFTVTVEKQKPTGGWQVKETLEDVTLVEEKTEEGKRIYVAYQNNKMSEFIDILIPEGTRTPLAKLWPTQQEQPLNIESKLLAPVAAAEFQGEVSERTGIEGLESLDDATMLVVPDLMTPMPEKDLDLDTVKSVQGMMIAHCEKMGDRVAVLDAPPDLKPQEALNWRMNVAGYDSSYAAFYYPWIEVYDPVNDGPKLIPPSGHMAGVWARNDTNRGVHKAPANEIVRGATGLAYNVTKGEQDVLNPEGVNCIRAFPGMGIRVWGARTVTSDPAWRYLNVRRLFNYVEKSIERGTQWVVFEPNEPRLWARVRRDVSAFLTTLWREGALFGMTPEQAFYVKCDEELNPSESRDLGRLVVEIGLAPVKPAEFVIFRISQWAGQ
jgi:hypothetical protein